MALAKITFRKCIQDSQEYGSDDEYMVSRVFFDLSIADKEYHGLHVDIKQTVGGSFEPSSIIEVGMPQGYEGPFSYGKFRDAAEYYYRSLVGRKGSGIHIEGGRNIRMQNNIFDHNRTVEFEVDAAPHSGW